MTQGATTRIGGGRLALLGALLGLAVVIALKLAPAPPNAVPPAPRALPTGDAIAALERKVVADPHDAAAWQGLGEQYFALDRFDDAARAFRRSVDANPNQAQIWSALGEAQVMASKHDPMPAVAAAAFARAHALDSKDPRSRYFLAVGRDLKGDHRGAIDDWLALLRDTPPGAPWENDLRRTIEQVGKINHIAVAGRIAALERPTPVAPIAVKAMPGPSSQDLAAAAAIPPSQQAQMAQGMVSQLEARLAREPDNVAGWIMLMRSRQVLNQPDRAAAALRDAIKANPGQEARLRSEAGVLGIR